MRILRRSLCNDDLSDLDGGSSDGTPRSNSLQSPSAVQSRRSDGVAWAASHRKLSLFVDEDNLRLTGSIPPAAYASKRRMSANSQAWANQNMLKNYQFFQQLDADVQKKVSYVSEREFYHQGTVLFQQGDPPGNCYVVISGEVVFHVKSTDEKGRTLATPGSLTKIPDPNPSGCAPEQQEPHPAFIRSPTPEAAEQLGPSIVPLVVLQRAAEAAAGGSNKLRRSVSLGTGLDMMAEAGLEDFCNDGEQTAEGFSTYTQATDFGVRVATFGPGKLFGELSMMQDQTRMATATCLKDTEFLFIKKADFDLVCKAAMKRKEEETTYFLNQHVPGMLEVPPMKGKPPHSYFFKKAIFPRGHRFLKQGQVAEESLVVISKGSVEFSHYMVGASSSSESRPASAACSKAIARTAARAGHGPRRCFSVSSQLRQGRADPPAPPGVSHVEASSTLVAGQLLTGGVFGSSPCAVGNSAELFTVTATSLTIEVFVLDSDGLKILPMKLRDLMREYLARHSMTRLDRLQDQKSISERQHQVVQAMRWRLPAASATFTQGDVPRLQGKLHCSRNFTELVLAKEQLKAQEMLFHSRQKAFEQLGGADVLGTQPDPSRPASTVSSPARSAVSSPARSRAPSALGFSEVSAGDSLAARSVSAPQSPNNSSTRSPSLPRCAGSQESSTGSPSSSPKRASSMVGLRTTTPTSAAPPPLRTASSRATSQTRQAGICPHTGTKVDNVGHAFEQHMRKLGHGVPGASPSNARRPSVGAPTAPLVPVAAGSRPSSSSHQRKMQMRRPTFAGDEGF